MSCKNGPDGNAFVSRSFDWHETVCDVSLQHGREGHPTQEVAWIIVSLADFRCSSSYS